MEELAEIEVAISLEGGPEEKTLSSESDEEGADDDQAGSELEEHKKSASPSAKKDGTKTVFSAEAGKRNGKTSMEELEERRAQLREDLASFQEVQARQREREALCLRKLYLDSMKKDLKEKTLQESLKDDMDLIDGLTPISSADQDPNANEKAAANAEMQKGKQASEEVTKTPSEAPYSTAALLEKVDLTSVMENLSSSIGENSAEETRNEKELGASVSRASRRTTRLLTKKNKRKHSPKRRIGPIYAAGVENEDTCAGMEMQNIYDIDKCADAVRSLAKYFPLISKTFGGKIVKDKTKKMSSTKARTERDRMNNHGPPFGCALARLPTRAEDLDSSPKWFAVINSNRENLPEEPRRKFVPVCERISSAEHSSIWAEISNHQTLLMGVLIGIGLCCVVYLCCVAWYIRKSLSPGELPSEPIVEKSPPSVIEDVDKETKAKRKISKHVMESPGVSAMKLGTGVDFGHIQLDTNPRGESRK